jgi:hypothetical protein
MESVASIQMAGKNTVILVLVFACGFLIGGIFTRFLSPRRAHPAKKVLFTKRAS